MIRAAWSILLVHCTGIDNIVFGAVLIGPQVSVYDFDLIAAPTVATVPIRRRAKVQKTGNRKQETEDYLKSSPFA